MKLYRPMDDDWLREEISRIIQMFETKTKHKTIRFLYSYWYNILLQYKIPIQIFQSNSNIKLKVRNVSPRPDNMPELFHLTVWQLMVISGVVAGQIGRRSSTRRWCRHGHVHHHQCQERSPSQETISLMPYWGWQQTLYRPHDNSVQWNILHMAVVDLQ